MFTSSITPIAVFITLCQAISVARSYEQVQRRSDPTRFSGYNILSYEQASQAKFTKISTTFVLPTLKASIPGSTQPEKIYAWPGLLGGGMLQAGVLGVLEAGQTSYTFWTDWFAGSGIPPKMVSSSQFSAGPGDEVTVTISIPDANGATVVFSKKGSNTPLTVQLPPRGGPMVTGDSVQIMVENYGSEGILPDFGTFVFTKAQVYVDGGWKDVGDLVVGDPWQISLDGKLITSSTISGSSIAINYIG